MLKHRLALLKSKTNDLIKKAQFAYKYGYQTRKDLVQVDTIPDFSILDKPYTFTSTLCREQHFRMPFYTYWCQQLKETPYFHRKQWEYVFICQVLYERGYFQEGKSAIGFGVGKEPLSSLFASYGVNVLATDLEIEKAKSLGWRKSDEHSQNLFEVYQEKLCDEQLFQEKVKFQYLDMNHIPQNLGDFDFCWSSCSLEHLGSIQKGLDFISNSLKLLKPGGVAVHTTEFNISSNTRTLDNNSYCVIYRKCDIENFVKKLINEHYIVETVDYLSGEDKLEKYIDLPPYSNQPHLRLQLANEFITTSLGLIIKKPTLFKNQFKLKVMEYILFIIKKTLIKIVKLILSNYHLKIIMEWFLRYIPWLKLRLRQLWLSENTLSLNNQIRYSEELSPRATKILSDLKK